MTPVSRILCAFLGLVFAFLMGISIICAPLIYADMRASDSPWCGAAPFIYGAYLFVVSFLTYACMGGILSRFEFRHAFSFASAITVLTLIASYLFYITTDVTIY